MTAPTADRRTLFFWSAMAASLALFSRSLVAALALAWNTDEYTYILLVLPVSLGLTYLDSRGKFFTAKSNLPVGLFLLFSALSSTLLGAFSRSHNALFLTILGLVLFWLSLVLLFYGLDLFRSLLFPLLFLLLLAPIPITWLNRAITYLQGASTEMTFVLFRVFGIPVFKNGFVLALPGLQIEVAKQCSGIRSSIMLLVTALILGHQFLRTFWGQLAFAAMVVPFAIAKNAVRIFTLSTLGVYVNRGFLEGRLHHEGGIVFFVLALGALLLTLQAIRFIEQKSSPNTISTSEQRPVLTQS